MKIVSFIMVFAGSALMAFNIFLYLRFSRSVRKMGIWDRERRVMNIPIVLLILFLIGYLIVGIVGKPDLVMASILFGGSIFVFVMLWLIKRTVDSIHENERLKAELSAAENANLAKTFFLSNMSHDIRTPINAIIGYTTLAKQNDTSADERLEYVNKIEKASRQLLDIVDDVLEMSRIESGKIELDPQPADLESCINDVGDLFKTLLTEKNIKFAVECDIRNKCVLCDVNLLNRVLMNLLSNAGKFTPEGGTVSLSLVEMSCDGEKGDYRFCVKDTGIGMDPEFVERIFEPFERERTSTVSKIQGTGLGMSITKSIVDLMGGKISVVTEKSKGSELIVDLSFPTVRPEDGTQVEHVKEIRFDGMRALLVEDNAVNMEIARMLLTQSGFEIDTAENGRIAVDMVSSSADGYYDVVLMDLQMPEMDGFAAAKAIRALDDPRLSGVPIIAMTANAFREDVQATLDAGMNAHIAKPIDVDTMKSTIKEVLGL